MSDESEVEKVLLSAGQLKYLGPNRAFLTLLVALWAARKKGGTFSLFVKLCVLVGGAGGYGYWSGFLG
jgi:hypothetical protein